MDQHAIDAFCDGALPRIQRAMVALALLTFIVLLVFWDWKLAAGFAFGSGLSFYNLHSLATGASGIAERIASGETRGSSSGIVARFLLRYVVIAGVAYGIFSVSLTAFYGLIGGLFLPVAGVGCEAVYELYVALWRGF